MLFRIDKQNAPELWENIGEDMVSKVVRPFSRSRISAVFSELTLDQIKQNRSEVEKIVKEDINHYFRDRGLNCEGFLLASVKLATRSGNDHAVLEERVPELIVS